jgi:hypothetical protein
MDGLLSFLTPEQQALADRQARQAMLTQLGFGLLQASTGAPGQRRPSLGQIVGQAGPGAMQAYQGSFDRTLQQIMLQQQMAEQQKQREAQQKQQTALQTFIGSLPEDQRARFEAFPTQAAEAMFRETKPAPGVVGEFNAALQSGLISPGTTLAQYVEMKKPPAPSATATATTGGARVGTIPQGFELVEDPRTGALSMRPIPGGPAEAEQIAEAEKAKGRKEQQSRAGGTVVQDLQRALNIVQSKPSATGRSASAILGLPEIARAETDVQAAKGFVESALSNVGLDTLQQMRENSPTGGALGQVPIQQQQRLEQVLGSLDLTQRKEVVEDNIKRVINIYMDIIHGSPVQVEEAYQNGEITKAQRDVFAFRHRLSFDELGKPLPKTSPKKESDQDLINRYLRR